MEDKKTVQTGNVTVVDIQFRPGQKVYFFDPAGRSYTAGDHVIIDTARGPEYGICAAGNHTIAAREVVSPLRQVLRKATLQDKKALEECRQTEEKAYRVCGEQIAQMQLDMQLVSAECAFDGSKILFFFTADERVDFRELVKSLAAIFHTRIELRQIGVRDKARMVGGLGICGRPFCCATFLDDFQPVSIKMAKTQSLSLNPTKISGTCGRLMCCLKYEQDAYEDLIRSSPKVESFVDTPDGRGTVVDINLLRESVKVRMENEQETIGTYKNEEIAILRSGKAKKNDPPIPEDLAPISGGKAPRRKLESEEKMMGLDAIKFRYSNDTVAESVEQPGKAEAETPTPSRKSHKNRRATKPEASQQEKTQKENKKAEQQEKATPPVQTRKNRNRRHYHHKPKGTDK